MTTASSSPSVTPAGKPHREFFAIDLDGDWTPVPGYPDGIAYKTLADNLDPVARTGTRSRLVRFAPGVLLDRRVRHDHWEEVYVIDGDLVVIDPDTRTQTAFPKHAYACRPADVPHGPFTSHTGCLLFELHYY